MKYIVAVSGGIDSVVLLDMLSREEKHNLVVAHFDHGIRPESDADARFVWALAQKYHLPFEVRRETLGKDASEATARERRYAFLRDIAKKYDAKIVTAHHQDDVIETIAINLTRGTGWRGLAVFSSEEIVRPLLTKTKHELREYALSHRLEWVEDETNQSDNYLRNRVRRQLHRMLSDEARKALVSLRQEQCLLGPKIKQEVMTLPADMRRSRYFFMMIPEIVAMELLEVETGGRLTRPQLARLLLAIKAAGAHTKLEPGGGLQVEFSIREFTMKHLVELIQ